MQSIDEYTSSQGCDSSRADAKHDFHGIFKADKVQEYVDANIPMYTTTAKPGTTDCSPLSEDDFVDKYELVEGQHSGTHKEIDDFIVNNLNDNIQTRYQAYNVVRKQHDFTIPRSLIQECLVNAGIVNDVFFICDVAYANVREDLKFANGSPQTFYWVQNAQTLYDPAGKTTWHSDKSYFEKEDNDDIEPGDSSPSSPSSPSSSPSSESTREICPNSFKKPGSKFLFCWQNAKKNIVTLYPEWSREKFPRKEDSYKFSQNVPEQMLYTNKNLFLSIRTENVNDYASHEAYLIITDNAKPGYYGYADKVLSAKGTGVLNAAELASYRAKGNDLKRFVKFINDSIKNPSATKLFLDEVMNYSSYFQVLAKKVGDASQSISCCQKEMNLQKFRNNVTGDKTEANIEDFVSNGNHAFVSFDRIAIVCALNYNCPIVIGNTQKAFNIYIRKDLINIHKQFDSLFNKEGDNYTILNQLKNTALSSFVLNNDLFAEINSIKAGVKSSIEKACYNLNITPEDDITYQNFLINYFIELNTLQIFSTIETSVLQFQETDYANKIKQIYADNLKSMKTYSSSFAVDLENPSIGLLDISSLTNVQDIISAISNNINKIFDVLKVKYDSEAQDIDKATYVPEKNPKHVTFVNIVKVLKLVEKILIDIVEIQKLLLTNVDSMNKLIAYQNEIDKKDENTNDNANDKTKLSQYVKKLPKGIATNITSYTPFTYYLTNTRTVRNSDVFFERSTSIFGTTTVILQIFNILNCDKLNKLKERFTKIIYNTLGNLTNKATVFDNISFISIINAAKNQLEKLLIANPTGVTINPITPANINELIDLNVFITSAAPVSSPEAASSPEKEQILPEPEAASSPEKEPILPEEEPILPEQTEQPLSEMRKIFKNKKLFISKPVSSNNTMTFHERVQRIREANQSIKAIFEKVQTNDVNSTDIDEDIQIAYENEIFIKGFIGIFTFMKYVNISNNETRIPALFKGDQENVLGRLFELLYLKLDNESERDSTLSEKFEQTKRDIQAKLPGFNFDSYNAMQSNDAKIQYIQSFPGVHTKSKVRQIAENFKNYVKYYTEITKFTELYTTLNTVDTNPPIYKSDFTVNSFQNLLEMNVVTVGGDRQLEDFDNINVNEINANVALLYFVENRIATMNNKPIPHPELIGLFSQLFIGSGILSQEYIKKSSIIPDVGQIGKQQAIVQPEAKSQEQTIGQRVREENLKGKQVKGKKGGDGDGEGLFDTLYDLFAAQDPTAFNEYRKNSYLLLNMPNSYEISINNFQSYPLEIRMYLQSLNRESQQEKKRAEQMTQLKNLDLGRGAIQPFYRENLQQPVREPVPVRGGKTKKYKYKKNKTCKKNKKSKRNKTCKKNRRNKNKTIKK